MMGAAVMLEGLKRNRMRASLGWCRRAGGQRPTTRRQPTGDCREPRLSAPAAPLTTAAAFERRDGAGGR